MPVRDERPSCLRCGKWMDEGFLLERGDSNAASVTTWIEGAPERSRWTGIKLKARRVLPVKTWRCRGCGALASFAPAPDVIE